VAKSAEQRRLDAVLSDERYGPALVRLQGKRKTESPQVRQVLNLISDNRGRDARKLILKLDEQRRQENLAQRRAVGLPRPPAVPGVVRKTRAELMYDAASNLLNLWAGRADAPKVYRNLMAATDSELRRAARIDLDEALEWVRLKMYWCPRVEQDWNPLFYHSDPPW
jgi:hypothetical protein